MIFLSYDIILLEVRLYSDPWISVTCLNVRLSCKYSKRDHTFVQSTFRDICFTFVELKYRVTHKSLRDFRPLRYSSRDGHAEGEHVNRGRDTASFCLTLQVLDMCTLGDATDVIFWQIPTHRPLTYSLSTPCFVTTAPLAVKPASTPRRLVPKKNLERFSVYWYDMLLSAVSVLVVAQSSSEIPEGLMTNSVYRTGTTAFSFAWQFRIRVPLSIFRQFPQSNFVPSS
jgi:hypothetical protein